MEKGDELAFTYVEARFNVTPILSLRFIIGQPRRRLIDDIITIQISNETT